MSAPCGSQPPRSPEGMRVLRNASGTKANMDRAGRKRKNGEVTALVDPDRGGPWRTRDGRIASLGGG